MKSKRLLFPIIVLIVAALAIAAYAVWFGIAKTPTITEKDFNFTITYEYNGETVVIEDVYTARFVGHSTSPNSKYRNYSGKIGGKESEDSTRYYLVETDEVSLFLDTQFCPDCMLGDLDCDCGRNGVIEPRFVYDDESGRRHFDAETLLEQGVKLIGWEYPSPIENTFVFSHMSRLSGEVVIPMVAISLVALLLIIVFVKKDKDLKLEGKDRDSAIFGYAIGFAGIPFFTLCTWFSDLGGTNEMISHQMYYFTAPITALCLAASVALRRKGYVKAAFAVQFVGPAAFVLLIAISAIGIF